MAREKGLEPLAEILLAQDPTTDPDSEAAPLSIRKKGVDDAAAALAGRANIIAETISEDRTGRKRFANCILVRLFFTAKIIAGKEAEASNTRTILTGRNPRPPPPSHRILAMRRGEKEDIHLACGGSE